MITIKQWLEVIDYRITGGGEYQWICYGNNAYCLDSWNGDHNGYSFSIIFDTETQEVFEANVHDYQRARSYRMINPQYQKAYFSEAEQRNVNLNEAYEGVNYVDLDLEEDWLEKAAAIVQDRDYDTRVKINLELDQSELLDLFQIAHRRDITFNQLVEEILRSECVKLNALPKQNPQY